MPKFIPLNVYKTILKYAPVVANDILIESQGKYLLAKRQNWPARGQWWTVGSRLKKNEHIVAAVQRVGKEELGIRKIKIKKFLGVFEFFCTPGKFNQKDLHYISFAFLATPCGKFKIKLDSQHSEYKFFTKPPQNSHPFFKQIFSLAKNKKYNPVFPETYRSRG